MKTFARNKLYRDQSLFKDTGFLLIATAFVLVKGFDMSLPSAVFYTPLIVFGGFSVLLVLGYAMVALLRMVERIEISLGLRRGAKH